MRSDGVFCISRILQILNPCFVVAFDIPKRNVVSFKLFSIIRSSLMTPILICDKHASGTGTISGPVYRQ